MFRFQKSRKLIVHLLSETPYLSYHKNMHSPKLQISMLKGIRYSMYVSSNIKVLPFNQISDVNVKIPYPLRCEKRLLASCCLFILME
jgi:hypothetical protein